ncbi:MAG: FG-GAP repeat domain-containing protein [Myxococcota bacterium]
MVLVAGMLSAEAALAANVQGTTVRLTWAAASGPVAGYDVQVSRGGRAFAVETRVAGAAAQVSGAVGETLAVRVAAFDASGRRGPVSPLSDTLTFMSPLPSASPGADLDGNGRSDALALDVASGVLNAVLLDASGARRWVTIGAPRDPAMQPAGFADVDGDGRADVIWRNGATGANELWLMRGLTYTVVPLLMRPARFELVAFRDFSGDRVADILWHDALTGESVLWVLGVGGARTALAVDPAPAGALLAAVCDTDGDGFPDLVWQNTLTRALEVWRMRGAVPHAVVSLGYSAASASVVGVGDLDANGVEDLVWRHLTSSGVALDVWFLAAAGAPKVGNATTLAPGTRVRGVVDLDSDGKDDLVTGSSSRLAGLAVLPLRASGSATRWQTRTIPLGASASANWQFLRLE